jgi:purine-binding chemotaxis protein CheW
VGEELTLIEFQLDERRFAVACELVTEVLPMLPVQQLPGAPEVLVGVARVRGGLLPLIDPRRRLGMPPEPLTPTCHILSVISAGKRLGLVVDNAEDVFKVPSAEICRPGQLEPRVPYGLGIVRRGGGDVVVLDLDAMVNHDEWAQVTEALGTKP